MNNKPYYDLSTYLEETFGTKVYKLALSGGMTCPNRDGTVSTGGCSFCSEGGSGDFAVPSCLRAEEAEALYGTVHDQITEAAEKLRVKLGNRFEECRYIAYFQSYTNTYAPIDYLRGLFSEAVNDARVCALSIGTRPDCVGEEVIELLKELNSIKPVWIELGLQTMHDETAEAFNRGYRTEVFEDCVKRLNEAGIEVIVHLILGLPGESREMMLESAAYVGGLSTKYPKLKGIKLQLLHVLKGTRMGNEFETDPSFTGKLYADTPEKYICLLADILEMLPEQIVIHRLTGDAPHEKLLFPMWSANKRITLNGIIKEMKRRESRQGCLYK